MTHCLISLDVNEDYKAHDIFHDSNDVFLTENTIVFLTHPLFASKLLILSTCLSRVYNILYSEIFPVYFHVILVHNIVQRLNFADKQQKECFQATCMSGVNISCVSCGSWGNVALRKTTYTNRVERFSTQIPSSLSLTLIISVINCRVE